MNQIQPLGITLLGLGPGDPQLITRQAWQVIQASSEIYLRTTQHPAVTDIPSHVQVHSFDHLFDLVSSPEQVYEAIIAQVIALGQRPEGVVYAVPGHPLILESTAPEIYRRACQQGLPVQVVEGLSIVEPVITALRLAPWSQLTLVDALQVARGHIPSFPPDVPALIVQMDSRVSVTEIKLALLAVYPPDHPIRLLQAADAPYLQVQNVPLHALDLSSTQGQWRAVWVPALAPATSFEAFQEVIARLRAPDGCPWDREQTHSSLRPYLLEEAYEVLATLDAENPQALEEELGDLLLQIVLHAQIASEAGEFTMAGVLQHINNKLVYRHPHVFGETQVDGVDHVLANWERLKAAEREQKGKQNLSVLEGVPIALPALIQAEQYQRRAARTGFEWPELQNVLDKITEELEEVRQAQNAEERAAEIGDLLFAVVNLARTFEVDPESSLRLANSRFRRRFEFIEQKARSMGVGISDLTIQQMLAYWQAAKVERL